MVEITEELKGNLEFMGIVRQTIRQSKLDRQAFEKAKSTLADVVKNEKEKQAAARKKRRSRVGRGAADGDDEAGDYEETTHEAIVVDLSGELHRGQVTFGTWVKQLCLDAITYMDPDFVDRKVFKTLPVEELRKVIEYATDIKFFGQELDRVAAIQKRPLFEIIAKLYHRLGSRIRYLNINMEDGSMGWVLSGA